MFTTFVACEKDSLSLTESLDQLTKEDFAKDFIDATLTIYNDVIRKNDHIFKHPERFANNLELLAQTDNYQNLELLVQNSSLELDLRKIQKDLRVMDEIANSLNNQKFTIDELVVALERQLSLEGTAIIKGSDVQLRGKMECIKAYDQRAEEIMVGLIGCVAASTLTTFPIKSRECAIAASTALAIANIQYNYCLKEQ